jgi:ATP adenylyltransferase
MDRLWAPWRMAYILSGEERADECIFCAYPAAGPGAYRRHLILCAAEHAFVMLNKFPYNNGHLMVVPRRHVDDPIQLDAVEHAATCELLRRATDLLRGAVGAQGFNIGMNLGRVAGAGIDRHCHWHIVPRWNGDTNFMPVVGDVKVMSEHLVGTYDRLVGPFAALGEGPSPSGAG